MQGGSSRPAFVYEVGYAPLSWQGMVGWPGIGRLSLFALGLWGMEHVAGNIAGGKAAGALCDGAFRYPQSVAAHFRAFRFRYIAPFRCANPLG